jgi:hypothetical protein
MGRSQIFGKQFDMYEDRFDTKGGTIIDPKIFYIQGRSLVHANLWMQSMVEMFALELAVCACHGKTPLIQTQTRANATNFLKS